MRSEEMVQVDADTFGIDPKAYERRWLILGSLCLCLVLVVATVSSLNVAIPTIARELKPSDTQILWIVDAYAVVFAGLLLFAGAIGDRFGRKGALLTGLVIFAAANVACSLAKEPTLLIGFRAVMGIGAALTMPATLSILTSVFPPHERPKAIAVWAAFAGAGGAIGPVISGVLLAHFWYGSVFFVAVPLALIAFVMVALLAPSSREGIGAPLDPIGALLSMVGFSGLLFAIIEGPEEGWGSGLVIGAFAVAVAALAGFVTWERRNANPMLDMKLFANNRFSVSATGVTMTFMAMFSMFFVLAQYLQYVRGYSALRSGVGGLPFAVGMILVSPRAVAVAGRIGVRRTMIVGLSLVITGLLAFSFVTRTTPYIVIALCLLVMSAGMGLASPSMTAGIMSAVPRHKAGVGSAVNDTTRELGGAIGIAIVGSIISGVYRDQIRASLAGLPAEAASQVLKGAGRGVGVVRQLRQTTGDPTAGADVLDGIRRGFLNGSHLGLRIVAVVVALNIVQVAVRHPKHVEVPIGSGH